MYAYVYELLVGGEEADDGSRQKLADYPSDGQCGYGTHYCQFQHVEKPVVLLCSIVVAGYRLHALIESHHYHKEEKSYAVGYSVGTYGKVAAVAHEGSVDE